MAHTLEKKGKPDPSALGNAQERFIISMNVRQLKETLSAFPEDMEVLGFDGELKEVFKVIEVKQTNLVKNNPHHQHNVVTIELYFH